MKTYRSHKVVQAGRITEFYADTATDTDGRWNIRVEDDPQIRGVTAEVAERIMKMAADAGTTVNTGWLVQYADDYVSWSPNEAFVDGYREIAQPIISDEQADAIMATRTHPKITPADIEARVKAEEFFYHDQLTICVLTMANGFMVVGKSAPASPENYNADLGRKFAHDDCIKQAWQLEGYLLCEALNINKDLRNPDGEN